jgi:pimeloyl-ACP methyl ester carboxylesterase
MRLRLLVFACSLASCVSACGRRSVSPEPVSSTAVLRAVGQTARWIEVDGCRVRFVESRGEHDGGVPWLFVHGIGGRLEDFGPLLTRASARAKFFAFDLPGFGASSNPNKDFRISAYVHILRRFLDAVEAPRAHLICHSMGGQICLAFALDNAQRVQTLTLIDAAGGYEPDAWAGKTAKKHAWLNLAPADSDNPPLLSMLRDERKVVFKRVFADEPMVLAGIESFTSSLRPRLRELNLPVLIVWGTNDPIFPVEEAFNLKENIAGSTLQLVEGADHQPFSSHPDLVLKWITEHHRRAALASATPDAAP